MNKISFEVWLYGLASALVSGAATGVAVLLAAPEVFSTAQWWPVAKVAAVGAVVGVANYLKQSPLPKSTLPKDAP